MMTVARRCCWSTHNYALLDNEVVETTNETRSLSCKTSIASKATIFFVFIVTRQMQETGKIHKRSSFFAFVFFGEVTRHKKVVPPLFFFHSFFAAGRIFPSRVNYPDVNCSLIKNLFIESLFLKLQQHRSRLFCFSAFHEKKKTVVVLPMLFFSGWEETKKISVKRNTVRLC